MGLDTTHGCWHGPYSAFHRWRKWVAGLVGIDLDIMEGFRGEISASGLRYSYPPMPWSHLGNDPIVHLLDHSDCDGEIEADLCGPIADRLESLLNNVVYDGFIRNDNDTMPRADYDGQIKATERFIAGLRAASAANEPVEFH